MKILLTGATGQVGHALLPLLRGLGEVTAPGRAQLDLAAPDQLRAVVRALRPDLIVNPAAFTAVDRAEDTPALAWRINAEAPLVLAEEARALGAALVQFSTDYVFDGARQRPYVEADATAPLNVYGRSKLAGEQAVAQAGIRHLILRTGWVYGLHGQNFLQTMLGRARAGQPLRVVDDQTGAPTWSHTVAQACVALLRQNRRDADWQDHGGLYHVTCGGATSWHGFAEAMFAEAGLTADLQPIASADYPARAIRPSYSVLDCRRFVARCGPLPAWREALRACLVSAQ